MAIFEKIQHFRMNLGRMKDQRPTLKWQFRLSFDRLISSHLRLEAEIPGPQTLLDKYGDEDQTDEIQMAVSSS